MKIASSNEHGHKTQTNNVTVDSSAQFAAVHVHQVLRLKILQMLSVRNQDVGSRNHVLSTFAPLRYWLWLCACFRSKNHRMGEGGGGVWGVHCAGGGGGGWGLMFGGRNYV